MNVKVYPDPGTGIRMCHISMFCTNSSNHTYVFHDY